MGWVPRSGFSLWPSRFEVYPRISVAPWQVLQYLSKVITVRNQRHSSIRCTHGSYGTQEWALCDGTRHSQLWPEPNLFIKNGGRRVIDQSNRNLLQKTSRTAADKQFEETAWETDDAKAEVRVRDTNETQDRPLCRAASKNKGDCKSSMKRPIGAVQICCQLLTPLLAFTTWVSS